MNKSRLYAAAAALLLVAAPPRGRAAEPCQSEFTAEPSFDIADNFGMNGLKDFDGDGHVDLTTGLDFYLGDGTGSFGNPIKVDAPWSHAFDMQTGDFDGDGILDAAVVGFGTAEIMFYYGRRDGGAGSFFERGIRVDTSRASRDLWHLGMADFNEDGRSDLVAIHFFTLGDRHAILLNEGNRQFTVHPLQAAVGGHMVTTGDFDGDDHADIAIGFGSNISLFLGVGDGTFAEEIRGRLRHGGRARDGHRFRAADVDGDGRSDLFATGEDDVLVYLGRDFGEGEIAIPSQASMVLPISGVVRFVELADINRDGTLDVVTLSPSPTGQTSTYKVFAGYMEGGDIAFVGGASTTTGLSGRGVVLGLGDVNGDGAVDMAITTEDSNRARMFLNTNDCRADLVSRGDANTDGEVNLTDAVATLGYLFSGGAIACELAAEVNGDQELNLSDPVYLLFFLFGGGPALVGPDPTACAP